MKTCWVLNFDAELELQDPTGYRRSPRMAARCAELAARIASGLAANAGGQVCTRQDPHRHDAGWQGRAYCPTPRALQELAARGVELPPAPSIEVLTAVNHRRFACVLMQEFGVGVPRVRFVETVRALDELLASPWPAAGWLCKRPLGFSGRQRKRLLQRSVRAAERTWLDASMTGYGHGLQVEPWVPVDVAFALHGEVSEAGTVSLHSVCGQTCDGRGAWSGVAPWPAAIDATAFRNIGARVGAALDREGYFGPFCVDGFSWKDGVSLLSEVNARYSMGWFRSV